MARTVRLRGLRFNLRSALVVVQVAMSLALLASATLMLQSAHAGRTSDPGFRRDDVINVGVDVSNVAGGKSAQATVLSGLVRAAASLPGVERAALAALIPLSGSNSQVEIRIAGSSAAAGANTVLSPDINLVGAGYFSLLDVPVVMGREFDAGDRAGTQPVAMVNESMARQYWDGAPLGQSFADTESGAIYQIVGVVRDIRHRSFDEAPRPMVFFSAAERPYYRMTLHVRTSAPLAAVAPALQRALHEVNRAAGIAPAEMMGAHFDRVTEPQQLGAIGATAVAALELALAVMALYGVIAFATSQRKREIGLRIALGAPRRAVLTMVMREGLTLVTIGTILGLLLAGAAGFALTELLIGVSPIDPSSLALSSAVLLGIGLIASYVPARRALKIDPSSALRTD